MPEKGKRADGDSQPSTPSREAARGKQPTEKPEKGGFSTIAEKAEERAKELRLGVARVSAKREGSGLTKNKAGDRRFKSLDPRAVLNAAQSSCQELLGAEPWENAKACLASLEGAAETYRRYKGLAVLSRETQKGHGITEAAKMDGGQKVGMDLQRDDSVATDLQRTLFREFRYKEAEGPREACSRLWYLCHRWLKPERHTKEQILELVILEQFLAILPPEIQRWVKASSPHTCDQAVALAEGFPPRQKERGHLEQKGPIQIQELALGLPASMTGEEQANAEVKQEQDGRSDSETGDEWMIEARQDSPPEEAPEPGTLCGTFWGGLRWPEEGGDGSSGLGDGADQEERPRQCAVETFPLPKGDGESTQSNVIKRRRRNGEMKTCAMCGKTFSRSTVLAAHQRTHTGEKPFMCQNCGKCFSFKSTLVAHERTHTGERPYTCDQCGKSFTVSSVLTRHYRVHIKKELFSCSECDKSFTLKSQLLNHQKVHVKEKPFKCVQCGESFSRGSSLKKHEGSHTGEKPFKCPDCEKSFNTSSQLVKHHRVHTGERPYTCADCGKSFSQWQILMVHQRIHTGEKPFRCFTCGKCFADRAVHIRHQKVHTGERPHQCTTCGKRFTHRTVLVKHQKIHTREALRVAKTQEEQQQPKGTS